MLKNKHKIIDAVFALSLQNGFDNVSMKQIQKASGLSAGTIYYHFKNKDEILEYMIEKYLIDSLNNLKENVSNFNGSFIEKIEFIFNYKNNSFVTKNEEPPKNSTKIHFDHKDYFLLLRSMYHQHPEIRHVFYKLSDDLYEFYYELFQEAVKNKEIRDDIDIRNLVIFIQTSLKGYIDLWIYQRNFSFEELVNSNIQLIWEAVKKQ
ncbi:TetR/AcrR family transcriptional regulator [Methanobrevibacter sp. TMH8]|uniref:TetR/AcrR family transcriptional regulator n=1 Tax=Methanobrevibacter sp. TMH8 TaxID=2848611 RepID=UPI001CCFE605|nr:TetR/AcrR family transcriptional regulator [Methanobrevibacter sp. TMH8]MBZ9570500.1 TetR/AcrR family transcriptional regulator [Methanobrevibacter sp. TMH8]